MKNPILYYSISLFLLFLHACQPETYLAPAKGRIAFSLEQKTISNGRTAIDSIPAAVAISVRDHQGRLVYENHQLALLRFGQGFISESLELDAGTNYSVTQFLVLDANKRVIYAAPLQNSQMAAYVDHPLPLSFDISPEGVTHVVPQVLAVDAGDAPQDFGYVDFAFEIVNPELVKIRTNVIIRVNGLTYSHIDVPLTVRGYDAGGTEKWSHTFQFTGPLENDFDIPRGFDHYKIEMDKWEIHDEQSITADDLWNGRVGGPLTVTYALAGTVVPRVLDYYLLSYENSTSGFDQQIKVKYEYNSAGKLTKFIWYYFNTETGSFEEGHYNLFTYDGERVHQIAKHLSSNGSLLEHFTYSYAADGRVSKIASLGAASSVNAEANFTYYLQDSVSAVYTFSNGGSFNYGYNFRTNNNLHDRTTRGSTLCSEGVFTYDQGINPFRHLGYLDYYLTNISANNRLTENVNYVNCSFPSFRPEYYTYEYDSRGYPTLETTFFRSGKGLRRAQKQFFYR